LSWYLIFQGLWIIQVAELRVESGCPVYEVFLNSKYQLAAISGFYEGKSQLTVWQMKGGNEFSQQFHKEYDRKNDYLKLGMDDHFIAAIFISKEGDRCEVDLISTETLVGSRDMIKFQKAIVHYECGFIISVSKVDHVIR
jgi:hypothetical protein